MSKPDLTRASVSEAAEALGKSHATVRRWCDDGTLAFYREPRTQNRVINVAAYLENQPVASGYTEAEPGEGTIRMAGVLKGKKHPGGRAWVCVAADVPISALQPVTKPASLDVAMAHTDAVLLDGYELQMGRTPKGSR